MKKALLFCFAIVVLLIVAYYAIRSPYLQSSGIDSIQAYTLPITRGLNGSIFVAPSSGGDHLLEVDIKQNKILHSTALRGGYFGPDRYYPANINSYYAVSPNKSVTARVPSSRDELLIHDMNTGIGQSVVKLKPTTDRTSWYINSIAWSEDSKQLAFIIDKYQAPKFSFGWWSPAPPQRLKKWSKLVILDLATGNKKIIALPQIEHQMQGDLAIYKWEDDALYLNRGWYGKYTLGRQSVKGGGVADNSYQAQFGNCVYLDDADNVQPDDTFNVDVKTGRSKRIEIASLVKPSIDFSITNIEGVLYRACSIGSNRWLVETVDNKFIGQHQMLHIYDIFEDGAVKKLTSFKALPGDEYGFRELEAVSSDNSGVLFFVKTNQIGKDGYYITYHEVMGVQTANFTRLQLPEHAQLIKP